MSCLHTRVHCSPRYSREYENGTLLTFVWHISNIYTTVINEHSMVYVLFKPRLITVTHEAIAVWIQQTCIVQDNSECIILYISNEKTDAIRKITRDLANGIS